MTEDLRSMAEQLVELVLQYSSKWKELRELPPGAAPTLLDVVRLAGYKADELRYGQLRGDYRDGNGPTGEKYAINTTCLFKALEPGGQDNYPATLRLDTAVCFILIRGSMPRHQLVELVRNSLDRSRPLVPVPLTVYGEVLAQYPREESGFGHEADPVRDESPLGTTCVGVHAYCDSFVDRGRTSAQHDALFCRRCHLRVVFPSNTATYGQLRRYLASVGARLPE